MRKKKKPEKEQRESTPKQPSRAETDQALLMKYQFYKGQVESSVNELQQIEALKGDRIASRDALDDICKLKAQGRILVPLGAGAFVNATVESNNVLLDIGSGVVLSKPAEEAKERVSGSLKEIEGREKELLGNLKFSEAELNKMAPELSELQNRIQTKQ